MPINHSLSFNAPCVADPQTKTPRIAARCLGIKRDLEGHLTPVKTLNTVVSKNAEISNIFTENDKRYRHQLLFVPLKSDSDKFPKILLMSIQVRFCTGYVEVITVGFEPHLNHGPRN